MNGALCEHGFLRWAAFKAHTTQITLRPSVSEPECKIGDVCLKDKGGHPKDVLECLIFLPPNTQMLREAIGDEGEETWLLSPSSAKPFPRARTTVDVA